MVVRAAAEVAPVVLNLLLLLLRLLVGVGYMAVLLRLLQSRTEVPPRAAEVRRGRGSVQERGGDHDGEQREDSGGENEGELHGWCPRAPLVFTVSSLTRFPSPPPCNNPR